MQRQRTKQELERIKQEEQSLSNAIWGCDLDNEEHVKKIAALVATFGEGITVAWSLSGYLLSPRAFARIYQLIIRPYYSQFPCPDGDTSPLYYAMRSFLPIEEIKADYARYAELGLSPNRGNHQGNPPLHLAVGWIYKKQHDALTWLLSLPAIDVGLVDREKEVTVLIYALREENYKAVDILLNHYVHYPHDSINMTYEYWRNYHQFFETFFELLLRRKYEGRFKEKVITVAEAICKTLQIRTLEVNQSALDLVIDKQDWEVAIWLLPQLKAKADIDRITNWLLPSLNSRPYLKSRADDNKQVIEALLYFLVVKVRMMSLDPAKKAMLPDASIIKLIRDTATDPLVDVMADLKDRFSYRDLQTGKKLKKLLHSGQHWNGLITLLNVCEFPSNYAFAILSQLSSIKIPVSASLITPWDHAGETVLHWMMDLDLPLEIATLEKANINFNVQDSEGNTVLHVAAQKPAYDKLVGWLLNQKDIKINQPNERGATPLLCALESENEIGINHLIKANLNLSDPNPVLNTKKGIYLIEYVLNKHLWVQLIHLLPHMNAVQLSGCIEFLYTDPSLGIDKGNSIKAVMNMVFPHFMVKASDKTFDFQLDTFFQIILLKIQAHDFGLKEGGMILQTGNRIPHDTYKIYQHCQAGLKEKTGIAKNAKMKEIGSLLLEYSKPNVVSAFFSSLIGGEKTESERAFYQEMIALINLCPLKDQVAHRVESQGIKPPTLQNLRPGDNVGL